MRNRIGIQRLFLLLGSSERLKLDRNEDNGVKHVCSVLYNILKETAVVLRGIPDELGMWDCVRCRVWLEMYSMQVCKLNGILQACCITVTVMDCTTFVCGISSQKTVPYSLTTCSLCWYCVMFNLIICVQFSFDHFPSYMCPRVYFISPLNLHILMV